MQQKAKELYYNQRRRRHHYFLPSSLGMYHPGFNPCNVLQCLSYNAQADSPCSLKFPVLSPLSEPR